ncbi:MAG: class I SAM-dependent methyltransferase [Ktedonobacteraceae bacterium]|nr:class I SAM-dependent methyltransferase [Ktedonobacteraceae bacterium]
MTDSTNAVNPAVPQTRKVPLQERAVRVGDVIVVNAQRVQRAHLTERLVKAGYQVQETPHFLLFTRAVSTFLAHWFTQQELDTQIIDYLARELPDLPQVTTQQGLGTLVTGIVGSSIPGDPRRAWTAFGTNTLQRLLVLLSAAVLPASPHYETLGGYAILYQRVLELSVGTRLLDAGCKLGLLPLVLADRIPFVHEIIGVDRDAAALRVGTTLATERGVRQVRYLQMDLCSTEVHSLGLFDTVIALHVLHHCTEADRVHILQNLLQITTHRLLLTVPYEQATEHGQRFSHDTFEALGAWCLEQLGSAGRLWCEDLVGGGLLLIERHHPA